MVEYNIAGYEINMILYTYIHTQTYMSVYTYMCRVCVGDKTMLHLVQLFINVTPHNNFLFN